MTLLYAYITGPVGAGKTQLIQSIGGRVMVDEDANIEYYQFTVDESLEVCLFCNADATRFDQLLQIPQRDMLGYIIVVDSADFESWSTARIMMANCRGYAMLPTVIAANKQDLPGAYTPEQVGGWIGMGNMIRVQGCVAIEPSSARDVFLQLLYSVRNEIERLDYLIKQIEDLAPQDSGED